VQTMISCPSARYPRGSLPPTPQAGVERRSVREYFDALDRLIASPRQSLVARLSHVHEAAYQLA